MFKKIFMMIMLVLCFSMVGCAGLFQDEEKTVVSEDLGVLIWPETELSCMIPKPEAEKGKIEQLSNNVFALYVGEVSESYFEQYVTDCIALGFNKNFSYSNNIFSGKNDAGYSLYMRCNNKIMYIKLESPNVQNNENTGDEPTVDTNTGNNGDQETGGEQTPAEATYKLGMGVVVSENLTNAQVDATVATVVLNQVGEIVACRIDAIQNKVNYADGSYTVAAEYKTKAELKEGYNMAAWGTSLVGNPTVKEWYLQAQAFEAYVVGMTAAEVEAMPLQTMSNGYQISADEALLATGCTIQITDFKAAVVKACNDDQAMSFETSKAFTLGVTAISADAGSDATNIKVHTEFGAAVVVDGRIVATLNDAIQPSFVINADNTLTYTFKGTKRELKEGYHMAVWGTSLVGNPTVVEWYLQSAEFSKYVVGMTAAEVLAMPLQTMSNGYVISSDEALLATGCTMQISGMQAVVAEAVNYAR